MIFDTHAHYDDMRFEEDREAMLASLRENGIEAVVNVGADMDGSRRSQELSMRYPFIYAAAGVHPSETGTMTEQDVERLRDMLKDEKTVAVGEIGLDYYWDGVPGEVQKKWFRAQLELAAETGYPVIIHSRDAAQDTYEIMAESRFKNVSGVVHCFSYGPDMAERFLKLGYYLGIGGVLTFQNAKKLREVVKQVPLERLVLETDAPYLAPVPYRGQRNSSVYLKKVAEEIARIKDIPEETVELVTSRNAKILYRLAAEQEEKNGVIG